MEVLPIDLAQVIAIIFGTSIVLIPVGGFTTYWVVRGLMNAYFRIRGNAPARLDERDVAGLKLRVAALEAELEKLRGDSLLPADPALQGRPVSRLRE